MFISKEKTDLFFRLSISVTVFGALFQIIPSSLTMLGVLGMVVFLGIQLYQKEAREPLDYARLVLITSFACNYICSLFDAPYTYLPDLTTKLALIAFLILYIKRIIPSLKEITQNQTLLASSFSREDLSYILADLATVYIVIASLFKMLHWEMGILNSNFLLVVGLFSALLSILASSRELRS